jgi:hypothetical protein
MIADLAKTLILLYTTATILNLLDSESLFPYTGVRLHPLIFTRHRREE